MVCGLADWSISKELFDALHKSGLSFWPKFPEELRCNHVNSSEPGDFPELNYEMVALTPSSSGCWVSQTFIALETTHGKVTGIGGLSE